MEFRWNDQAHKLQGIDAPSIHSATLKELTKNSRHQNSMFAICVQSVKGAPTKEIGAEKQQLIDQFSDIFQEPNQVPPARELNHRIALKEGAEPVNVRPYRYAYFQKAEIEKQVHDMLQLGLIRSSTSSFSSPVLLVKKKDGSLRFCTN